MEIVTKKLSEIKPYKNNPRNNDKAVEYVANSIKNFGFKVPIVIDKDNIIVCGHTRYKASQLLGLNTVPCVIADDLSKEQIKAFRLADNKVSEQATWNKDLLNIELDSLVDFNMVDFGFDKFIETKTKQNERHRTMDTYNLGLVTEDRLTNNFWQMPIIENNNFIPSDLIGFNYAKSSTNKATGIHFYLDDYQFERLWSSPDKYIDLLKSYECILSPDFSLYSDMPMAMKIWNTYRSRWIGNYYQSQGIKVIPTISWAEKETYKFCFEGIPKGSIVSISTIGVKQNSDQYNMWKSGVDELIKQIKPSTILIYGGKLEYDFGTTNVIYYDNKVTERMKRGDKV